jgi:hypothetical protein
MSLPNVYFTLNCPFVTIIGMYTNVPEGGSIDSVQQQWLTQRVCHRAHRQGADSGFTPSGVLIRRPP